MIFLFVVGYEEEEVDDAITIVSEEFETVEEFD